MKPFALELHERVLKGETIEQLSKELGIPVERIALRVRVAAELRMRQASAA